MHIELEQVIARVEDLEKKTAELSTENAAVRARVDAAEIGSRWERRRLRIQAGLAFTGLLAAVLVSPANRAAIAQGYGVTLASLNARLNAVEGKTQYMSVDTKAQSTTFSGCNVFVNDGGGSTSSIVTNSAGEGLGNLIIGYNATRVPVEPDLRTGSHNLILGDSNDYNSYGGLIAGYFNAISSPYASISGGQSNKASGPYACVSGGQFNEASGLYSSVSGGGNNTASYFEASVSGGEDNTASGAGASVSGGGDNAASGFEASVSGGAENVASSLFSSVSGGNGNAASGVNASVSGGQTIVQADDNGWAAGSYHSP